MLYLYPTTIGDDVLEAMAESEKVCKYIDLPLQHASDAVLKRMKRPGTRAAYEQLLDRIRDAGARCHACAPRSSSGFRAKRTPTLPNSKRSSQDVRFDHVGVFTYSHEEGTSAHQLADDVPARDQDGSGNRLMSLQKRIVGEAQKAASDARSGCSSTGRQRARARAAGAAGGSGAGY